MTNHMCKYGRIRRINTAYTSIKPYSAYQLSPYRIRYGDVKFRRIRRINTIYNTATGRKTQTEREAFHEECRGGFGGVGYIIVKGGLGENGNGVGYRWSRGFIRVQYQ